MPVVTESETSATSPDATSGDPRRLVLADLVARLAAGLSHRAREYDAAAAQADGALQHALEDLSGAKRGQAADLAPLARALGVPAPSFPPVSPPRTPPAWGVILGEAFQDERVLEATGRELTGLTPDPAIRALATRLTEAAWRDREAVRKLYLRYS